MTRAILIDGKQLAAQRRAALAREVESLTGRAGRAPALTVILVGEDAASQVYVRNKHRACEQAGIRSDIRRLDASTSAAELRAAVDEINADASVDGLLVQLPVPDHIDPAPLREWIAPEKDVDGLHPVNAGLLASGTPGLIPCTPLGCLRMLEHHGIATSGKRAVVLGRSLIVGRPMAALLSQKGVDATVTICHSRSGDLAGICREADILVAAAGVPQLVKGDWVQPGAVVLDVGIHRIEDAEHPKGARLVGDVDPEVADVAGYLSPVPGGVGPMTIAMLLENTVTAFRRRTHLELEGVSS